VRQVYSQMERDFGLVPPLTIHSSQPEILAAVWSVVRESLLAGPTPRVQREAVATAVSQLNQCPYCVAAHSMMLTAGGLEEEVSAINHQNLESVPDTAGMEMIRWAAATLSPGAAELDDPSFDRDAEPYLIATALVFHYLNRMANVFLDESPFAPLPQRLRPGLSCVGVSLVGRRMIDARHQPGDSLELVVDAPLPKEFSTVEGNDAIASGFAAMSTAVAGGIEDRVSAIARQAIESKINQWGGATMSLESPWVESDFCGVPDAERGAAQLPVLTALASYRVTDGTIREARRCLRTDADLIAVTSWAAWLATKRIATWISG